jgi:hypothetical protein
MAEDEYGRCKASGSQAYALFHAGDAQAGCAMGQSRACDFRCSMTIAVGLDHSHERSCGGRPFAQGAYVTGKGVQPDFRPDQMLIHYRSP